MKHSRRWVVQIHSDAEKDGREEDDQGQSFDGFHASSVVVQSRGISVSEARSERLIRAASLLNTG